MIINIKLLAACLVAGAVYIIIIDRLWNMLEKHIPVFHGFPESLVEDKSSAWYVSSFIVEYIFFVLLPAVIYGWFYTVIPFSGIRGGVAVGLYLFLFGMIPVAILTMFRIKIPAVYVLYLLTGLFLRAVGSMMIIGYLYSL